MHKSIKKQPDVSESEDYGHLGSLTKDSSVAASRPLGEATCKDLEREWRDYRAYFWGTCKIVNSGCLLINVN